MATVTLPQATSFQVLDTASTASTGVLRDSQGNIAAAQITGSEIKSTGIVTITRSAKTSSFTADTAATYYACDATGGAITVTLPPAATVAGRLYTIKKLDNVANVVIDANSTETIDGATTVTLSSQWAVSRIVSNGTNWETI